MWHLPLPSHLGQFLSAVSMAVEQALILTSEVLTCRSVLQLLTAEAEVRLLWQQSQALAIAEMPRIIPVIISAIAIILQVFIFLPSVISYGYINTPADDLFILILIIFEIHELTGQELLKVALILS
jgi:hypothetical protein